MQGLLDEELPYERFLKYGSGVLSDAELIAILLRTGSKKESVLSVARMLMQRCGKDGLIALYHLPLKELMRIPGIGEVKAVRLKCVAELSTRIATAKRALSMDFQNPSHVAAYYMEQLRHKEEEHVISVMLDNRFQLIADTTISIGDVHHSIVSPREVYKSALQQNASYLILLHNHPSGDCKPSEADLALTKKMKQAGDVLGVPLVDHIIIGDHNFFSLAMQERIVEEHSLDE